MLCLLIELTETLLIGTFKNSQKQKDIQRLHPPSFPSPSKPTSILQGHATKMLLETGK